MGNRIAETLAGRMVRHSYNARNQLIRSEDDGETTDYRYDRRGNLREVLRGGELTDSYTFDAMNMLAKAYSAERGEAEYAYDGLRNRVKRLERLAGGDMLRSEAQAGLDPCAEMRYVLDMTRPYDNLLMTQGKTEGKAEGETQRFVWGNELLAAAGEENYFFLQDHLHSPIRLIDGKGAREDETCAYDEFGVRKVTAATKQKGLQQGGAGQQPNGRLSGSVGYKNPFGFTGYQPDAVSGLCYAQARYYDPANARMVEEDPIKSGLNWYAYCAGNPVRFMDPTGLTECEEMKTITYDRDRAVQYIGAFNASWPMGTINPGDKYFEYRNKMFENISGNNCANAVSQALWFGGIPMSSIWHHVFDANDKSKRDVTDSFTFTSSLVNLLSTSTYSTGVNMITNKVGIPNAVQNFGIQRGDVVAFYEEKDPTGATPYHVAMVSEVDTTNGKIFYSGNTSDVVRVNLADVFDPPQNDGDKQAGSVTIIKMKDEMTVPYSPQYPSPPEQGSGFTLPEFGSNKISFK